MSSWRDRMKKDELYAAMTLASFRLCVPRGRGTEDDDDLPPETRNFIESTLNGTCIASVMEKVLCKSDIDRNQNRLSFGVNKVKNEFLKTPEEVEKVETGLEVTVVQPCLEITPNVELRKRSKNDGRYSEFVLTGNWSEIVQNENNGLQKNKLVRLWSFRMGTDLCFALVKP
ncbi:hypothetical protein LWI29_018335 [Acer saccharum]|uniref:TF-B3 domain-containing protein n=1 Tax=Acer saccharum TaxID=4024 RepID=A0AA39RQ17_ACESA|nr:hypothetical protein LWI29_018335 [Acer saccharum]